MHRTRLFLLIFSFVSLFCIADAEAIPPFARKYEMTCGSCHQGHYPRLNEFGRRFRENGYQLPEGAEAPAVAARSIEATGVTEKMRVFKELPITFRGQLFGQAPVDPGEGPAFKSAVYSMVSGGGSVAKNLSLYFTWTPFPEPDLHQIKIGFHNLFSKALGEGTLNIRVGRVFLLDFQRPSHRFLSPGVTAVSNVTVGSNSFTLAEANDAIVVYGRPKWGAFHYEIALVTGDVRDGLDRDDWKDIFGRLTYTAFQNTDHQATLGIFGYQGTSEFETPLGDLLLRQRDRFNLLGVELEVDLGPINLFGMAYRSGHSDPKADGLPVVFTAYRGEAVWFINHRFTTSVRFDGVLSAQAEELRKLELGPHLTYKAASNLLTTIAWRQDLANPTNSSLVSSIDVTF